jgi:hypothetical protein
VTASFEFAGASDGVRIGFTPDLPLVEFYGLVPTLIAEPPGNTDLGRVVEPPAEVRVGRIRASFEFDPAAAPVEVGFSRELPLTEFYGLVPTDPVPATVPIVWRLFDPRTGGQIAELLDCWVQDAFSRFARTAEVAVYDPDSALEAAYPLDTPVELWVSEDGAPLELRFGGFISKVSTDADTTTWKLLAHDFWLRRRTVFKTYTEQTLLQILEDLVTTLTPLTWDPALVAVTYDKTLSQTWKGDSLDVVLGELSATSDGEEFGADDQMRFFFRPRRSSRSPRDFVEGEYLDAEFEDDAQAEVNKATIYWGQSGATGAVSVQDRASQLRLQQQFEAPRPVVVEVVKTHPEIGSEAEARQKAAAILADRQTIRTGTVTTWGGARIRPGDVCAVRVPEQQIDGTYRIAQVEYDWDSGETVVKLAENSEGVVDVLAQLSDEVSRIDARAADGDAPLLEIVDLTEEIVVDVELTVWTWMTPGDMFVFGAARGGLGDPIVGGGVLGDRRGDRVQVR